jgi:hypothetical protein
MHTQEKDDQNTKKANRLKHGAIIEKKASATATATVAIDSNLHFSSQDKVHTQSNADK